MLLSHKTSVKLNNDYSNIVGHMCYAAYKLWNVCNYERKAIVLPNRQVHASFVTVIRLRTLSKHIEKINL